jgi:hypothetical protein
MGSWDSVLLLKEIHQAIFEVKCRAVSNVAGAPPLRPVPEKKWISLGLMLQYIRKLRAHPS